MVIMSNLSDIVRCENCKSYVKLDWEEVDTNDGPDYCWFWILTKKPTPKLGRKPSSEYSGHNPDSPYGCNKKLREQVKRANKKWRDKNKEYFKKYQKNHPEKYVEYQRRWRKQNVNNP
jgi:hypothetical protein